MSLKLKPDGTVEADTPQELAEYQYMLSHNGTHRVSRKAAPEIEDGPLPEAALKLVNLLLPMSEGMDSREVAKAFNLAQTKGIGGPANSLAAWGKRHNMRKALLVRKKTRNPQGKTIRTWKLSDFFRKKIRDGEVPGLKLES